MPPSIGISLGLSARGGGAPAYDVGRARIPSATASGEGVIERVASGAVVIPFPTAAGTGTVTPEVVITGSGAATITMATAAGTGLVSDADTIVGSGEASAAAATAAGTGVREVKGAGSGDVFEGGVFDPEVFGTSLSLPAATASGAAERVITATGAPSVTISTASGAGTVAAGGNPLASLWTGGVQGGQYDLSDLTTLFQDTAGTTPVTTGGQTLSRINDISGNGFDMILISGSATYQASGGLHWMAPSSACFAYTHGSEITLTDAVMGASCEATIDTGTIMGLAQSDSTNGYFWQRTGAALTQVTSAFKNNDGSTNDTIGVTELTLGADNFVTVVSRFSVGSSLHASRVIHSGGTKINDGTGVSAATFSVDRIGIGALPAGGGPYDFGGGRWFRIVARFAANDGSQDTAMFDWLNEGRGA